MNLIADYDAMTPKREPYLAAADRAARLSLHYLNVRGTPGGISHADSSKQEADLKALSRPYSDACGQAASQLAATLKSLLLPPNSAWFKLGVPTEFDAQLAQFTPEAPSALSMMLGTAEGQTTSKMAEHGVYAESEEMFRRLVVEGQVLCQVTTEGYRTLPLRCFCVKRRNGKVRKILIKEELYEDGKDVCLYTLVDYDKDAVYQQKGDQKQARKVAFSPKQYFVASDLVPSQDADYCTSLASRYYGTMHAINFFSKKIQEIVHWAALNLIGIDPSIAATPQEFKEKIEKGDNVFSWPILPDGRMAQVGFFSAAPKTGDLATLNIELQRQEAILFKAFSLGLLGQSQDLQGRERVTAAEILARTQIVDAQAQGFASALMTTFQKPLVEAYLHVLDIKVPMPDGTEDRPIILAGANLLSRMVKVNQLLSSIQTIATMKPDFVQRLDDEALFLEVTTAQGYENAERFIRPLQPTSPTPTNGTGMAA